MSKKCKRKAAASDMQLAATWEALTKKISSENVNFKFEFDPFLFLHSDFSIFPFGCLIFDLQIPTSVQISTSIYKFSHQRL